MNKNTLCLWYEGDPEAAATFYGGGVAKRAFEATMGMKKIDVASIEGEVRGG